VKKEYLELTRLIERLHRRFLDLLRAELNRLGIRDINSVQALLIANIGKEEIAIRDLVERGYYQGSNVSYNIKKLAEMGYLEHERSAHDRRSVSIRLTDKALNIVDEIRHLEQRIAGQLDEQDVGSGEIDVVCQALRRVERTWTDYVHYGRAWADPSPSAGSSLAHD
jgi:DNA-binding MarR family transcriptional regulator